MPAAPAPNASGRSAALRSLGHANHRERAVRKVRQDEWRDLREVTQQIALRQRGLLQRRIGRPVHSIQVREADLVWTDGQREARLAVVELLHYFVDLVAAA
jgi:hypothetical protein